MTLGMITSEADIAGWRGAHSEGRKLKDTEEAFLWTDHANRGTNHSGFTSLPGGFRPPTSFFDGLYEVCKFWTATETSSTNGWSRELEYDRYEVGRIINAKTNGFSVRCLKD